jgi:hypothetical protein
LQKRDSALDIRFRIFFGGFGRGLRGFGLNSGLGRGRFFRSLFFFRSFFIKINFIF